MLEVQIENIIPVTEARDRFNQLVDSVEGTDEMFVFTKNGKPSAILVGVHHLEKLTGESHEELFGSAIPEAESEVAATEGEEVEEPAEAAENPPVIPTIPTLAAIPDAAPEETAAAEEPTEAPASEAAPAAPIPAINIPPIPEPDSTLPPIEIPTAPAKPAIPMEPTMIQPESSIDPLPSLTVTNNQVPAQTPAPANQFSQPLPTIQASPAPASQPQAPVPPRPMSSSEPFTLPDTLPSGGSNSPIDEPLEDPAGSAPAQTN